jgi:hypothetical protein
MLDFMGNYNMATNQIQGIKEKNLKITFYKRFFSAGVKLMKKWTIIIFI